MRKALLILAVPCLAIAGFVVIRQAPVADLWAVSDSTLVLQPKKEHYQQAALISNILTNYHYSQTPLDDDASAKIYDNYLSVFDNYRMYFLEGDVKGFESMKTLLDDELQKGNVQFAFEVFSIFKKRLDARLAKVPAMLAQINDFSTDEMYEPDRTNSPWAKTDAELDEIWRKSLKNQLLSLKLADKELGASREVIAKRYERLGKVVGQYHSEDVFELFMNSFTSAFDPHTNYFSPISAENFEIDMSLSLEGIGARLVSDNDFVTFSEIIPGGPAYKSQKISPRDRIVAVAQEKDTAFTDIVGWRTDDAVQLIRGPKGSVVRLQILPADADLAAKPFELLLVRDKIKLEEQAATKKIVEQKRGNRTYKLGIISIPTFYRDFEAASKGQEDFRSTSRDVDKLLQELKEAGVNGVVVDLRNNGGGALTEAIELTGLFIKEGPVVQVKNNSGKIDLGEDTDPAIAYDGPMVVLINRFSASASEIFAGAIQDYKRGIVVGETSYGKGTVQNLIDLGRLMPEEEAKLGELKLTLAKYYRVNGSSTQHQGVKPDIEFPSPYPAAQYGESAQPNALSWDQIKSSKYQLADQVDSRILATLNARYVTRLRTEPALKELQDEIKAIEEEDQVKQVSLNETVRKQALDEQKTKLLQAQAEESESEANVSKTKDVYMDECLRIMADWLAAS